MISVADVTEENDKLVVRGSRAPYLYDVKQYSLWMLAIFWCMLLFYIGVSLLHIHVRAAVWAQLGLFVVAFYLVLIVLLSNSESAKPSTFILDHAETRLLKNGQFVCPLNDVTGAKLETQICSAGNRRFRLVLSLQSGNSIILAKTPLMPPINKQPGYLSETSSELSKYSTAWRDYHNEQTGFSQKDTQIFQVAEQVTRYLAKVQAQAKPTP